MSKILFIDVDGTLVDYEGKLPLSAAEAIKRTRAKGNRVYICTGRSKAEVYKEIWDIGLDGMIGGNGSYVEDRGRTILHQKISEGECRQIVDYLEGRHLDFYIESNSGLYASSGFETGALDALRKYTKNKGKEGYETVTVKSVFPDMIFGGNLYRDDVNKISYVLKGYDDFIQTSSRFPSLKNGTWGGKGEEALFGDIGVKDIDKATAIDALLKYLGSSIEDTVAFGDAKVDIPMLEYCNFGVAMGSGGEEIKAMADYVTDDVEKDGLYKAFDHLKLL